MAQLNAFVNNLQTQLTCSICDEIFTNPRTLQCLHSFCLECIGNWNESCRRQRQPLTCPCCRSEERLEGDVSDLRSSFYLGSLLQLLNDMRITANPQEQQELTSCVSCKKQAKQVAFCPQCEGMICSECVRIHQTITALVEHHQTTMFSDFKKENINSYIKYRAHCEDKYHGKNKLDYYCTTCQKCICLACNATAHKPHHTETVKQAAEEVKVLMKQDMAQVNKVKEFYERDLQLSKQNMSRIENETNAAIKKVSDEFKEHIKVLTEHKIAVINSLQRKRQMQKKQNDEEQREILNGIECMSEFILRGQTLQDENVAHFILKSRQERSQRCETFLEKKSLLSNKPVERNASVLYMSSPQVTQCLKDIGSVVESVTDPLHCSIENLNDIRCGFVNNFEIVTRNSQDEVCVSNQGSIDVQIQDAHDNDVEKEVTETETGKYTVNYRAEKPCDYTIHVRISGKKIKNSPQTVKTLDAKREFRPVKSFGERGSGKGQLNSPQAIALNDSRERHVAIADRGNNRIVIFSVDGDYVNAFGNEGTGDGQLSNPLGVAFNDDRILVTGNTDNGTGRLQEFDLNGTFCRTIYRQQGVGLHGICTTNENIAVCCDDKEWHSQSGIKLFKKQSGELVQEIPCVGHDEVPWYIAYGSGKYFVSYPSKHYIRVFDKNGEFLYKFGEKGDQNGQFDYPDGLAVVGDCILVCDADNHRVQMINQDGQFIRSFGGQGSGVGQFAHPIDIAATQDGQIIVLEISNHRVQVWQ